MDEWSDAEIQARRSFTLDLCPPDAFTLIVLNAASRSGDGLNELVSKLSVRKKAPLHIVRARVNFDFVHSEAARQLFPVERGGGAILVRPDQHILRTFNENEEVDTDAVENDILQYLGTSEQTTPQVSIDKLRHEAKSLSSEL